VCVKETDKFKGVFNVAGEVHTLYGYYNSIASASYGFKARLERKFKRKLFLSDIDYTIKKI
jgi:hypothetical protein